MSLSAYKARGLGNLMYAAYKAGEIELETVHRWLRQIQEDDPAAYHTAWVAFCVRYDGHEREAVAVAGPPRGGHDAPAEAGGRRPDPPVKW